MLRYMCCTWYIHLYARVSHVYTCVYTRICIISIRAYVALLYICIYMTSVQPCPLDNQRRALTMTGTYSSMRARERCCRACLLTVYYITTMGVNCQSGVRIFLSSLLWKFSVVRLPPPRLKMEEYKVATHFAARKPLVGSYWPLPPLPVRRAHEDPGSLTSRVRGGASHGGGSSILRRARMYTRSSRLADARELSNHCWWVDGGCGMVGIVATNGTGSE